MSCLFWNPIFSASNVDGWGQKSPGSTLRELGTGTVVHSQLLLPPACLSPNFAGRYYSARSPHQEPQSS